MPSRSINVSSGFIFVDFIFIDSFLSNFFMPTSYIKADMDSPIHRGLFSDTLQSLDAHKIQPPADSVH